MQKRGFELFDTVVTASKKCSCDRTGGVKSSGTISGTVTDKLMKENLLGAHVVNLETKEGVATDDNGYFKINANPDDLIRVSFVGYKEITLPASLIPKVVEMMEDKNILDEVVITAKDSFNNYTWLWVSGGLLALFVVAKKKKKKTKKVINE